MSVLMLANSEKGGYGRLLLPVPHVMTVLALVLVTIDLLDAVTAMYGWVSDTDELFGWNLPPLLVVARAFSHSLVFWLGAPISFILRLDREFPIDVQRHTLCHGEPERRILLKVMAAALGHALCIWGVCFLVSTCLAAFICKGAYDPSLVMISDAQDIAVDHPLVSNIVSCCVTVVPAMLATFIAAAVYEATGFPALSLVLVPALYVAYHYVLNSLAAFSPIFAVSISFFEIVLMPLFSAYPIGFDSFASMIPAVAWILWWFILDCAIVWTALQGHDRALVGRCS